MPIVVRIDVELARRKMSVGEFAERVGLTPANVAVLKNGRAKAVRFSTLEAIFFTNVYLNSVIAAVFALGVLSCFRQVILLMQSVSWIETFARAIASSVVTPMFIPRSV